MGFWINIWLALKASDKQIKELAKKKVGKEGKRSKGIPLRAILMMKRNTNDDDE